MNIIYASCTCSKQRYNTLFANTDFKPGQQVQKYNRLLMEGLAQNEGINVETITSLPITRSNTDRLFIRGLHEKKDNIKYNYLPIINISIIKHLFIFLFSFFSTLKRCNSKEEVVVICDILSLSVAAGSLLASKVKRVKSVGIVTDIPSMLARKKSLNVKLNTWLMNQFSSYVFLTEQMNDLVNKKNKPYVVLEGHVDIKMQSSSNILEKKYPEKVCIYAGGLDKKYGLDYLVKGFLRANIDNAFLHIYGNGDYEQELKKICSKTDKVKYFGVVPNDVVVEEQLKATLLINPRPTHEEYTKYSFPSKNMEYMVSGTPTLTTKLPGMPSDYNDYVYLFEGETADEMAMTLKEVISKDRNDLHTKGEIAKQFVLKEKNNYLQAKKIIEMLENTLS